MFQKIQYFIPFLLSYFPTRCTFLNRLQNWIHSFICKRRSNVLKLALCFSVNVTRTGVNSVCFNFSACMNKLSLDLDCFQPWIHILASMYSSSSSSSSTGYLRSTQNKLHVSVHVMNAHVTQCSSSSSCVFNQTFILKKVWCCLKNR